MKTMEVQTFRSVQAAKRFIKFQGWTTRQAKVRMFKWPEHEWSNKRGNVPIVRLDETPGGWNCVFAHGAILTIAHHGLPMDG